MEPQPANHYMLTKKQRAILDLLYRFRFATSEQLSRTLNISKSTTNKRLQLMMQLGYIERRHEPEYHLLRKHASYYLSAGGIKILKSLSSKRYSSKALLNIRKSGEVSEQFVNHCLTMFDIYHTVRAQYVDSLQLFTKTQMASMSYFPKKLPDAHLQLGGKNPKLFLLDLLHKDDPFFVATRRIMQYIDFATKDIWPSKYEFPTILLVCDSLSLQKRLLKKMQRKVEDDNDSHVRFFITTIDELATNQWHDMTRPEEILSLSDI